MRPDGSQVIRLENPAEYGRFNFQYGNTFCPELSRFGSARRTWAGLLRTGPQGGLEGPSTDPIPSPRPRASISGQLPAEYGSFCLWEIVVPLIVSGRVRMILS